MTEKKETKKTTRKKTNEKRNNFWNLIEEKLIDFGTIALKKGITNMAIAKIDDTEEKVKEVLDQKFRTYKSKVIKIVSFGIAFSFLSYGILEFVLRNFGLENYTNLIFGGIFLVVALIVNDKK